MQLFQRQRRTDEQEGLLKGADLLPLVLMATGITAAPVWEAISAVPDFALPNWPSRERVPSGKMPSKRPELTISLACR